MHIFLGESLTVNTINIHRIELLFCKHWCFALPLQISLSPVWSCFKNVKVKTAEFCRTCCGLYSVLQSCFLLQEEISRQTPVQLWISVGGVWTPTVLTGSGVTMGLWLVQTALGDTVGRWWHHTDRASIWWYSAHPRTRCLTLSPQIMFSLLAGKNTKWLDQSKPMITKWRSSKSWLFSFKSMW